MDEPIEGLNDQISLANADLSIFNEVDDMIGRAVTIGDPLLAFEYGSNLIKNSMLKGLALAKLLYRLKESWPLFEAAGFEDDLETMSFIHMGVSGQTTRKYIMMWESIFENHAISEETRSMLRGKPIRELLLLTAAVREGSIGEDRLKDIALGVETVRDVVRSARGEQTSSSSAIRIFIQMQDSAEFPAGTVYARRGDDIEVLFEHDLTEDPKSLRVMAITRLLNCGGVQEKYNGN